MDDTYGHIRDVELLTDERGVDPVRKGTSNALLRAIRSRIRMRMLDGHGDDGKHHYRRDLDPMRRRS